MKTGQQHMKKKIGIMEKRFECYAESDLTDQALRHLPRRAAVHRVIYISISKILTS